MKKNELVHLHALLARVAADYRERGLVTDADLEPYRDAGVGPTSLTAPRSEHRRAVRLLLSILAAHSDATSDSDPDADSDADSDADTDIAERPDGASAAAPDPGDPERPTDNH